MNPGPRSSKGRGIMILMGLLVLFCVFITNAPASAVLPVPVQAASPAAVPVLAPWRAPVLEALPPKPSAEEALALLCPYVILMAEALCLICLAAARFPNGTEPCAPTLPVWVALWEHQTDGRKKCASFE